MRLLAILLAFVAGPALAQSAVRINGSIASVGPDRVEVRTEEGNVAVALPANVRISAVKDRALDSIKPGEYVASAALRGRDGKLHAQEVRVFPESMRGLGEGHR